MLSFNFIGLHSDTNMLWNTHTCICTYICIDIRMDVRV